MDNVIIFQRVFADYRTNFFSSLGKKTNLTLARGFPANNEYLRNGTPPNNVKVLNTNIVYFLGGRIWYEKNWYRILRSNTADLVIISPTPRCLSNFLIVSYCKLKLIPIAGWGMGQMPGRNKYLSYIHYLLQFPLIKPLNGMICYSSAAQAYYNQFKIKKILIAPNAIDIIVPKLPSNREKTKLPFRLVFLGRLIPSKHLLPLIRIVNEEDWLILDIIGDGPKQYIDKLKYFSNDRIKFLGHINGQSLSNTLQKSDLFVLPSRGGLAINHAMAAGLPVLVSTGDGTEQDLVIEGLTGYFFKENDWLDLRSSIKTAYTERDKLHQMGENAQQLIKTEFSLKNMTFEFCNACSIFINKQQK